MDKMKRVMVPIVDRILNATISKKLTVFVIACIFVYLGKIDSKQWVNIAMIYIGIQGIIDSIVKLRK
jgi:hypothetical protein